MLNDKSRHGVKHLPNCRKWVNLSAGQVFRWPESRIAGGWAAGPYDFYPVQIVSFDLHSERVTIRGLTRNVTRTVSYREAVHWAEHAPFGTVQRSRNLPEIALRGFRYQRIGRRLFARQSTAKQPRYV